MQKAFTSLRRRALAEKLDRFAQRLEPAEHAYLAGLASLGSREIQAACRGRPIADVMLEFLPSRVPLLS